MSLPRPVYIGIRIVIPIAIIAAGILGNKKLAEMRQPPNRRKPPASIPLVETVRAEIHEGELTIQTDGTVVPFREIALSAEVAGRVIRKSADDTKDEVRAGRFVRKGQLLVEIDPRDYELEVTRQQQMHAQAAASIEETKAEIENSTQQIALLEKDFARAESDLQKVINLRSMGAAIETDQDDAEQSLRGAKSALTKEQASQKLLNAKLARLISARDLADTELKKARLDLTRCRIVSPCDGVIVEDQVELDAFVQRGSMLMRVQDTSAAEVRTSLRVDEIYWLWQDQESKSNQKSARSEWEIPDVPVSVFYELNGATFRWEGRLSRHEGPGLDERTRTIPCRVIVEKPTSVSLETSGVAPQVVPPPALLRGMFVTVKLRTDPHEKLVAVPEVAIRPGDVIWAVSDRRLKRLPVRVARVHDGRALIHHSDSGIEQGDQIVISPLSTETSGMEVRIKGENSPNQKTVDSERKASGAAADKGAAE